MAELLHDTDMISLCVMRINSKTIKYTHITGLEVGFLGTDQERCISNGGVSVLHLLVLLFVFNLRDKKQFMQQVRNSKYN